MINMLNMYLHEFEIIYLFYDLSIVTTVESFLS